MYVVSLKSLALIVAVIASVSAYAVKMDETTHDMVIERLEIGIESLDKNSEERTALLLRLGDLYADRARLKSINEVQANCDNCFKAKEDRQKAISSYQGALSTTSKDDQGRVVLQLAHLYNLNNEPKKSSELYKKILNAPKKSYSSEVKAMANSSLGDGFFRQGEFKKALNHYQAARKENLKNKGLIEHRIAWCHLNLGQTDKAIKTTVNLLKSPDLLATHNANSETKQPDLTFVQDVSQDLAKFLARGKVGPKEIQMLKDLSPEGSRKTNLHTLASELDRVGNKSASLIVWAAYVDEGSVQPIEKLEVQVRVAQIFYDQNKLELSANAFEKATLLWKTHGCQGDQDLCGELKLRLRKMVTAWNKAQKKKPTNDLLKVYIAYVNVFTDDTEMLHWGAVVARDLKKSNESAKLFHLAALSAFNELKKTPGNKTLQNILEGSLLGEIEMAELSKNPTMQESAYNFYLQINPNGSQATQVKYQRAHVYTQTNRHRDAFNEFHQLATSQAGTQDLRLKSADLALDSLVALKDDASIQVRALEYARLFPVRKVEYLKISRNATLNIVAANLKNKDSSDRAEYKRNLLALNAVNLDGADDKEKIKFFKNKIVIAQKALELAAVAQSSDALLKIKTLSEQDREWSLAQKVWAAEIALDFKQAYQISKKMQLSDLSPAERELRLALLAELAGINARAHQEKFLKLSKQIRPANLVRLSLIKKAKSPWRELEKHLSYLQKTPDLLADITLDVFARDKQWARLEKVLKTSRIEKFPAGQTLARQLSLKDFEKFDKQIRNHQIYGYSDSAVQKTLKERLKLINQSERGVQQAIAQRDWTLQVLTLSQLARENRRLYQNLMSLPVPKRLNAQQREEYVNILKQQSEPYLTRSEKYENQVENMWRSSNSVQALQSAFINSSPEIQNLYRDEITKLAQNATSSAKNRLLNLLNTPYRRPSQKDIYVARRDLQADPFDRSKAETLRDLEAQSGNAPMVAYLDERIAQLKKGKVL